MPWIVLTNSGSVLYVVAIVASIFAAAASPCTAAKPLVEENLGQQPSSPAAQDFIRVRCDQCGAGWQDDARRCYELLLPYAASINGSYNRAAIAAVTALVSKLTFFAGKLQTTTTAAGDGECMQVVNEAIGKGKDEALAKLHRLDAIGDDKVDAENPDLVDVANWIVAVNDSFAAKCRGASNYASTQEYLSTADAIIVRARPYWDTSLSSPDGSGP
ncbi:hypothetical protein SORBI_3008G177001 [Sorghum bicolor]|uniref:Pectinesterase inhibitor domain-containing protein n=1 Tax=Sorghum bicolor TaxID=4558 RepID=A0A1Z5R7W5_SORBI|nr:hypothetical protein SORBI_3008G177001 [Sorghum bicolor]